ncbi:MULTISPECIES: diacylglycerol kinase [unclassified Thioalkalivibrio]|uniref:diacylglycerol kinase n=1 Tax=unclassified Thioalkalivibrio TaxID=2621013 RepID=UPI0003749F1F|nr:MULTISPECIES: diacylglycerol kinase [unclassified Thioalkalivibrio]
MAHSGRRGLNRVLHAFGYSWRGLREAYQHESAFRQELALLAVLLPLAIWLGESGVERALLAGSALLILVVELLNSAVEAAIDRFGDERHPLSARAKDMASAAVLVSFLLAALVWGLILL